MGCRGLLLGSASARCLLRLAEVGSAASDSLSHRAKNGMLGRTALLLAHTTLARGLVARAAVPALSVNTCARSASLCMQAQASRPTVLVPVADVGLGPGLGSADPNPNPEQASRLTVLVPVADVGLADPNPNPEQAIRLTVLVPVADDSEEIETACITDTLTRAGAEVVVAS